MRIKFFFTFFISFFFLFGNAQDMLYTITGSKIEAKILEINQYDIKYKDLKNIDSLTFNIRKSDLILIKFSNGSSQIINENPPIISPKTSQEKTVKPTPTKKTLRNIDLPTPNIISINALSLMNGDFAINYDRDFPETENENVFSFTALAAVNFNSKMGILNAPIISDKEFAKKKIDIGVGINYTHTDFDDIQFFIGFLAKNMTYNYQKAIVDPITYIVTHENGTGNQFSLMINNGCVFNLSPDFTFRAFAAIGVPFNNPTTPNPFVKMYLGYCIGYRF
jgi:hypothetical protein